MIAELKNKHLDNPDPSFTKEAIVARNHNRLGKYEVVPHDVLPPTLLTPNFQAIMEVLYDDKKIPDSFGLCGVISVYTLLHRHPAFPNINFDLESFFATYRAGGSASERFYTEVANDFLLTDYNGRPFDTRPVTDQVGMRKILAEVASNNTDVFQSAFIVAYLAEYLGQKGQHTHWLYAEQVGEDQIIVGGDLRPFGLKVPLIGMSIENLVAGIAPTVGGQSTVSLNQPVIGEAKANGFMSVANTFETNVSLKRYRF